MAIATTENPCVVGSLACQRESYLKVIETDIVSCVQSTKPPANFTSGKIKNAANGKDKNSDAAHSNSWLLECVDSVLFPEGGGQPSDHGTIELINGSEQDTVQIEYVQRQGLRCVLHSPRPFSPGDRIRQVVDFRRRWDHMQQHTGQHLLSAVMDTYDNLETLGWGMGKEGTMNYVDLPRKPSPDELQAIQSRCSELIRNNLPITVQLADDVKAESLPDDYDKNNGVIRVINIEGLDKNQCCGTHLSQTSHIALILLHSGHVIHSTNYRQYFTAGDRAISMSANAIDGLDLTAKIMGCGSTPEGLAEEAKRLTALTTELKRREKKLLLEIAKYEGERVRAAIEKGGNGWVHRSDGGLEFANAVLAEVGDSAKDNGRAVLVAVGAEKSSGPIVVAGEASAVDRVVEIVKKVLPNVKGGGARGRWQGKVLEWKRSDLKELSQLIETS